MYILNIASSIKNMTVNELRDFIFENCYERIEFGKGSCDYSMKRLARKDLPLLATKLIGKIAGPRNAKEHYQSFLRKKNTKSVKQSKIITRQPNTSQNPNIVDIKSVIIQHPKTSHKLSKKKFPK